LFFQFKDINSVQIYKFLTLQTKMLFLFVIVIALSSASLPIRSRKLPQRGEASTGAGDSQTPDTCLTFAFDDTFRTGKNMASYLSEHNWNATFYISPARLGCLHADYLNWWDVNELYEKGHEIGCHGYSHEKSLDLDAVGVQNQFCMCRAMLRRFETTSLAYPHAQVNETIKSIAQECGFSNGRGANSVLELIQPRDMFNINSYSIRREDTCQDLYFRLEDAILSSPTDANGRKKWIILNNHVLCEKEGDNCNKRYPYSILRSTFECFMKHVKHLHDQGYLCVKNVKEIMNPTVNDVPRSMRSVDLPSDFSFNPVLNPNAPESSSASTVASSMLFLLAVMAIVI
jgi:peptidoglycan/xylan/chitin deacetylase (PgdA/CDA1 family)